MCQTDAVATPGVGAVDGAAFAFVMFVTAVVVVVVVAVAACCMIVVVCIDDAVIDGACDSLRVDQGSSNETKPGVPKPEGWDMFEGDGEGEKTGPPTPTPAALLELLDEW